MINLLPPQLREEYTYARRSSILVKAIMFMALGLLVLVGIIVGGTYYLRSTAKNYADEATNMQQSLTSQRQTQVESQAQNISNNIRLAVDVLSREVLFSKLLQQLAVIIPDKASLSGLTINQLDGAIDVKAQTADYNAATQLQVNMTDPNNKIFSKADIISITCDATKKSGYPCAVVIRASFAKDNPFLFLNSKAGN